TTRGFGKNAVAVTWPKVAVPNVAPGVSKVGVLVKLKASARNWNLYFSPITKFLNAEKSILKTRSLETSGRVRLAVPYVNGAGAVKAAVLNHWVRLRVAALSLTPGTTLGRSAPQVWPGNCKGIGSPDCRVMISFNCQPPASARYNGFPVLPSG